MTSLTITESGSGPAVLVLHGGAGPFSVAGIAEHFARTAHVLTATLPGWNGTVRPDEIDTIADLAAAYLTLLRERELHEVLVIGSSVGGWIAAEMAAQDRAGTVGGVALIDATGVWIDEAPMPDFFGLDARAIAEYSYHDPDRFYQDPADVPAAQLAVRQANMVTLRHFASDPYMHDPSLLARLSGITIPALLVWGESDRIVTPAYGAAYAAAFGNARLEIIGAAGHLPHMEQPDATFAVLDVFANQVSGTPAR
ncbi:alpha/beta fold hydrolase [Nocardia sp. NBC_01327]|uniref:alpha/beta fold hydrolase n=1 Tax=Nocardia sp. NBC_01327 TaxID=2903593 RepID=UPI002E14B0B7|nr:alpha/beta hydrolase [Nocardia sp. NBC_01327]